ncbi:MAG: hypothetical protein IT542_06615 [Rubellimicrobium sp.]|nr:hypothetical protein [Rubellimicrobium sp.]
MTRRILRPAALLPLDCAALALALLAPMGAAAQQSQARTFAVPAGCTAYLTVQSRACSVSHHFTCEGDPEGWQRRVDMDESGVVYFGAIDGETQWMESYHMLSGHAERLEPSPADPASFSDLQARSVDTWDFRTNSDEVGQTRYVGQDRLTGATEVIDGIVLEATEFAITAYGEDGTELWRSTGNEYISRDWGMFISGTSSVTADGETWDTDNRPVEFILPGEPGFLSAMPRYGCGVVMSQSVIAPLADQAGPQPS